MIFADIQCLCISNKQKNYCIIIDKPVVFSYNDYNNDKRSEGDKVPFPTFQRAAGWCKAVLGFGQLAPEQPAEKIFILSRTGRDSPVTEMGIRRDG